MEQGVARNSHWRTSPSTCDGSGAAGSWALITTRLCERFALKGWSRAAREPSTELIVAAAIVAGLYIFKSARDGSLSGNSVRYEWPRSLVSRRREPNLAAIHPLNSPFTLTLSWPVQSSALILPKLLRMPELPEIPFNRCRGLPAPSRPAILYVIRMSASKARGV